MPTYSYRALTNRGQEVKNKIEDNNKFNVIKQLKRNGLTPISVTPLKFKTGKRKLKRNNKENIDNILKKISVSNAGANTGRRDVTLKDKINLFFSFGEKIKMRDVMIFTQNFYLLKKANFNNIHALSTIIDSTENLTFRAILEDILDKVEGGENMYITMEEYPSIFPFVYTNIIKVGELSGSLTQSLGQAIKYLDDNAAMTKKIRDILIPNLVQFISIFIMLILGTLFAIPQVQNVFESVGTKDELPAITQWFSEFLNGVVEHWYIPTFIIIGAIVGIVAYVRTPKGRYNFHYFKYTMPIFGKLIYAIDFQRLIRALLLNIENGMRIQDALEVGKNVTKNYVMLSMIETSINNILIGASWIEPFERSGLSSPMITEMLKIGMQTDLAEMMQKLLDYMDIDIQNILEKVTKAMPQILYAIVGVILIFFVLVVLVPMLQMYMGTFLFSAAGV